MIFLIFILIFVVFVFFCMIGFVGFKIFCRNRKLMKEVDEEVRIEEGLDKDCFYLCYFVLLEFV